MNKELVEILKANDSIKLKDFIDRGFDIKQRDQEGNSLLMYAVFYGQIDVIKFLLEKKYSGITERNNVGNTALILAAEYGRIAVLDYLLSINKDAARIERNNRGMTALMKASIFGQIEMVKHLLEKKYSEINEKDNDGNTAFIWASAGGKIAIVDYFLSINKDARNERNYQGKTALILAAINGQIEMVKYLLEKKYSEINEKDNDGNTALLLASAMGKIAVVDYLLSINKDAARNGISNDGTTALQAAVRNGQIEVVKHLLEKKYSEINEKNNIGNSVLLLSAFNGRTKIIEYLLDNYQITLEDINKDGDNVLSFSAWEEHLSTVEYLLEKGAYIDMLRNDGRTARNLIQASEKKVALPLLIAAEELLALAIGTPISNSQYDIFAILGKSLNARQFKTGQTAFHLAILNNKKTLVKSLFEEGADISMPNRNGETPFVLLGNSKDSYFHALHLFCQLFEIEKNVISIRKEQNKSLPTELKKEVESQKQEFKEVKEFKETKEAKELRDNAVINKPTLTSLGIRREKILNDFESLLDELPLDEMADICLKLGKLLINANSPLFDPSRAYQFLNHMLKQNMLEVYLNEAREQILEILISKKVVFSVGRNSEEMLCETVSSDQQAQEENKESFDYRLKCIIGHILHASNSVHNELLGNYIAQYVFGHENSISGIEGIKGKNAKLHMAIIENLKKEAELSKKREKELKEKELEIEKLRQQILLLQKMLSERQSTSGNIVESVSLQRSSTVLNSFQSTDNVEPVIKSAKSTLSNLNL